MGYYSITFPPFSLLAVPRNKPENETGSPEFTGKNSSFNEKKGETRT
jgi:hypothetical protein